MVLKFGSIKVMMDMGIDENCTYEKLLKIKVALEDVDAVLFTHATYRHIGAFPIWFKII